MKKIHFEYKIVFWYLVLGFLWILFSDKLLLYFIEDQELVNNFQLYKGWFYVIITAALFYVFLHNYMKRIRKSKKELNEKHDSLLKAQDEIKVANEDLLKAKEKAQESDNLKTAFLNNISHEFRTPLNGILGFTDLLTQHDCSEEQRKLYRNAISESGKRLANLITDTVEISKVQSEQLSVNIVECKLDEFLSEISDEYKDKLEKKNIEFKFRIKSDFEKLVFKTDCLKLKRSIIHLMDNAYKFTREGFIKVECKLEKGIFYFNIEDSGIGIEKEIRQTIFKPFYHIRERSYSGCGLGLSIIKSYFDLLDGKINIESEENKGTKISLILPVEIIENKDKDIKKHNSLNGNKAKVLVAEDEYVNYLLLEEILKEFKFDIHRAENGKEAVDLIDKQNNFDLILMDIKMPEMSGYEATKIIRDKGFKNPIIAQSAYFIEKDLPKLKEMGFDDLLIKPIKREQLVKKISTLYKNDIN